MSSWNRSQINLRRREALRNLSALAGTVAVSTTPTSAQISSQVEWEFETGSKVISSPTVVNDTVYIGSDDNNVYALHQYTGKVEWTFETGGSVKSSPMVVDGIVFVGSDDSKVYALNASNGNQHWATETGGPVRSSPVVADQGVFIGSNDGNIYRLAATNGEIEWSTQTGNETSSGFILDDKLYINNKKLDTETGNEEIVYSSDPHASSMVYVQDDQFYGGTQQRLAYFQDREFVVVREGIGNQILSYDFNRFQTSNYYSGGIFQSTPTKINKNQIIFGGNDGYVTSMTVSDQRIGYGLRFETDDAVTSSPTVVDNTVFVGSEDNSMYGIKLGSGKKWEFETSGSVISSPTVADGTVFFGSHDGNVYAIDADIDGSSQDSRVSFGVLGHNSNLRYAGQTIDIADADSAESVTESTQRSESGSVTENSEDTVTDDESSNTGLLSLSGPLPAVTVGGAVAGPVLGYGLYRLIGGSNGGTDSSKSVSSETGNSDAKTDAETTQSSGDNELTAEECQTAGEAAVETAVTAKSNDNLAAAVDAYNEALTEYHAALNALDEGATEKRAEIEEAIESTREELDTVETTHERDETHQSVNDKLNTISAKLDSVADDQATGISQSSHQTLEEAEELIKDATATAAEYEFDTLTGQLAEEKERYTRIKEQIEKDTPPTTVHSPPRQSLTYEDIKKGDPIGSGGNADVYRATATKDTDEITLAIKEPRMSGTIDTETIDQLINEAKTWQQLDDHDHIVSVINYGSAPLPWIAMEYMDGGNLSERTGELPFEQTLWTAQVMTRGIRYAHKRGVAHLDLKPSNILFRSVEDAWDVPKIADWGLSKHLLEHSQSVEGMSPRYAAPEQLDPEQFGETDTVTDVYQLGTLLYELFTGEPPFDGQTYEVMNKIQSATPTPPSERADLPEAIDDILLTALATERDDRYDDVLYIRDALQDLWKEYN